MRLRSAARGGFLTLLLAGSLLPALVNAAPAPPAPKQDPAKLPLEKAQALVDKGKIFAFFDAKNLAKAPVLSARSALLMDADTGQILWEKNADVVRPPASTTKILTGLLLAENTQPDDIVTVMDPNIRKVEPSSLHLRPWEKLSARDLLYALILRSANDGAVVVAQHVSGSVPKFAEKMNARARELGAVSSNFVNPHGLHHPDHYTTARDLALIARAALQNPRLADAVGTPRRKITRSKSKTDNVVSSKARKFFKTFQGANGVKTGYTRAAGYCFVGSATRDGRRLLSVILDAHDNASGETMPLLSWGFRRFQAVVVARKGETVSEVPVRGGQVAKLPVVAARDLRASADILSAAPTVDAPPVVTTEMVGMDELWAPIRQGQEVGRLLVKINGVEVSSAPLLAGTTIEPSPIRAAATTAAGSGKALLIAGAGALVLVGCGYGTATAKSARRRRRRLAAARRGVDSPGPRPR